MSDRFSRRRFVRLSGGAAVAASLGTPGLVRAAAADDARRAPRHSNVIIIGGGLSGLMAGRELQRGGVDSFLVLEARERVGGRTLNMPIGGGHIVEVGGEWIGPGQNSIAALIDELGIGAFDAYYEGDTTYDIEGAISRGLLPDISLAEGADFAKVAWQLDRLCKQMPIGEPWRMKDASALDRTTLGDWLREHASTSFTPSVFRLISRAVMSGYPERISLLWVLHYLRSAGGILPVILNDGGAQDQRIDGGSQVISERLAADLGDRVLLGQPVLRIEDHAPDRMRVVTPVESFTADRVIVAMAPSDTARIEFTPALPKPRQALVSGWARLPRLPLVKAAMLYETPFWRADGLNGSMQSDRSPIQLVFDNSPEDGSIGVLSCFLSIVECPHLADRRAREEGLKEELARYFGPKALRATGYVEKDWAADPWSTGCITPLTPGVLTAAGEHLRKPTGRIFWAGTESAKRWCGYMDGAISAGARAANEVHASLKA
ncbi:MAG: FAD-dependent oxidoreductase [Deltaproteobacteria bacterium]|nr:FAD-dependent oxidoreductase [Deltaproteobacteria bacterium]